MGKRFLFALPLFLVSGLAQADTRIARHQVTLDAGEEGALKVAKEKRQTKLTFKVTSRHLRDEDVGQDIVMWCIVERLDDQGEWQWSAGNLDPHRSTCTVTVPVAVGQYRLHLKNSRNLSSLAEFTVDVYQGQTEGN